jgi:hypothetical protein
MLLIRIQDIRDRVVVVVKAEDFELPFIMLFLNKKINLYLILTLFNMLFDEFIDLSVYILKLIT